MQITILKRCCTCKVEKPSDDFAPSKGQKDGLRRQCRVCRTVADTKMREANREKLRQKANAHYAANRDRVKETNAAWRARNPEKVAVFMAVAYQRADKVAKRVHKHNYRARKRASPTQHSAQDVRQKYVSQSGKCYWCSVDLNGSYEVDHIFAVSKGGSNGPENICLSCRTCNRQKHAKSPHEFAGRLL